MGKDIYHITAREVASVKPDVNTHFLNENARRFDKPLGKFTGLKEIGFALIEVEPGDESTEHHKHYHEEECVYVLQGKGVALIGSETHEIGPGDFLGFRKGGLAHSLKNTGDEPLRCVAVSQRKDHDVSDYPRLGKRLFRNKDLTWNMVDITVIDRPFGAKT